MTAIQSSQPESAASEVEATCENHILAERIKEIGLLLQDQGANEYRVRAYLQAAKTLMGLHDPVREILEQEGTAGLVAVPTVGKSIANLIEQYLRLGHIALLDRLRGEETAERIFATVPSVGHELARRIHEHLEIETLPELLASAADGRLEEVPGIGRKRVRAVRECLSQRLSHSRSGNERKPAAIQTDRSVPVSELLDIDTEYRHLAEGRRLPKIAPRQFNPGAVAWLPILHTQRGDRHYSALYSNTARAHQLNAIKDWVIIYRDDAQSHGRWTVITSQFGKLRGQRIVRGREQECLDRYAAST